MVNKTRWRQTLQKVSKNCSFLHIPNDSRKSGWRQKEECTKPRSEAARQLLLSHKSSVGLMPFQISSSSSYIRLLISVFVESRSEEFERSFHVNSEDLVFTLFNIGKRTSMLTRYGSRASKSGSTRCSLKLRSLGLKKGLPVVVIASILCWRFWRIRGFSLGP